MQYHFTYDELTPLEQCIADFMARQECKKEARGRNIERKKKQKLND